MSEKHTPGPWTFDKDAEEITCEKRRGMAAIATVETGWAEPFESEQQANAHLIAAAPDLLAALREARRVIATALKSTAPDWFPDDESVTGHLTIQSIDAAIAKAEGQQ